MDLECFPTMSRPPEIVPGRPNRDWMDAFSERHPYRCLGNFVPCRLYGGVEWRPGKE